MLRRAPGTKALNIQSLQTKIESFFKRQIDQRAGNPSRKYQNSGEAAVIIPVCSVKGKASVLFTLRSSNLREHTGEVSFPGGKREIGDHSLIDTALRETKEEIHLDIPKEEVFGPFIELPSKSGYKVVSFVANIGEIDPSKMSFNEDEVAKIFTVDIDYLLETKEMEVFRGTRKTIPTWNIILDPPSMTSVLNSSDSDNTVQIWGLSGYILGEFLRQVVLEEKANL